MNVLQLRETTREKQVFGFSKIEKENSIDWDKIQTETFELEREIDPDYEMLMTERDEIVFEEFNKLALTDQNIVLYLDY